MKAISLLVDVKEDVPFRQFGMEMWELANRNNTPVSCFYKNTYLVIEPLSDIQSFLDKYPTGDFENNRVVCETLELFRLKEDRLSCQN